MSSSAAASDAAPVFSGENQDGREYKRWKVSVKNKLLTMHKLPESARGAFTYPLEWESIGGSGALGSRPVSEEGW